MKRFSHRHRQPNRRNSGVSNASSTSADTRGGKKKQKKQKIAKVSRCIAKTKSGIRCKRTTRYGKRCGIHGN